MKNKRESIENDELIPMKFYLSQNYPNPFNEKTKIKYCIPYKSEITIAIYNSEGELLKKLIDKEQDAGTYEIEFSAKGFLRGNANNLPAGVYLYKLQTGPLSTNSGKSYTEIKKMEVIE